MLPVHLDLRIVILGLNGQLFVYLAEPFDQSNIASVNGILILLPKILRIFILLGGFLQFIQQRIELILFFLVQISDLGIIISYQIFYNLL